MTTAAIAYIASIASVDRPRSPQATLPDLDTVAALSLPQSSGTVDNRKATAIDMHAYRQSAVTTAASFACAPTLCLRGAASAQHDSFLQDEQLDMAGDAAQPELKEEPLEMADAKAPVVDEARPVPSFVGPR